MIKLIQPVVLGLSVVCLTGTVFAQDEVYEDADYAGLPVATPTGAHTPVAVEGNAEFSSVEVSEAGPMCGPVENQHDYAGTPVVNCMVGSSQQTAEWSYLY